MTCAHSGLIVKQRPGGPRKCDNGDMERPFAEQFGTHTKIACGTVRSNSKYRGNCYRFRLICLGQESGKKTPVYRQWRTSSKIVAWQRPATHCYQYKRRDNESLGWDVSQHPFAKRCAIRLPHVHATCLVRYVTSNRWMSSENGSTTLSKTLTFCRNEVHHLPRKMAENYLKANILIE